jgi:hypothetical protein
MGIISFRTTEYSIVCDWCGKQKCVIVTMKTCITHSKLLNGLECIRL